MKFYSIYKKTFSPLALAGLLALGLQPVNAASIFSAGSSVTLTIDSITSSSANTSDLSIGGLFEIGDYVTAPGFGNAVTGDGRSSYIYTSFNLPFAAGAGDSSSQLFSAQGGAGNGSVNNYYQSYGTFDFANNSSRDTYTVNFSLDYYLNVTATGQFSESHVSIDYFDYLGDIFGSDQAIANAQTNTNSIAGSGTPLTFQMILNPGDFNTFYTDVAITGAAITSPVPLPAAFWLFLSGVIGLRGYRTMKAHS